MEENPAPNGGPTPRGLHRFGRRSLLAGAAVAGLGALIAAEVASSAGGKAEAPPSEETRLRHLLRRAGFGASAAELDQYRPLGLNGTVDLLVDHAGVDNSALEQRLNRLNLDLTKRTDLERWWLLRMIYTARPLEEKMTLFWHGLLTSAFSKVGKPEPMLVQNNFYRAHALDRFPDILKGISRDPAMMIWLDTASNRKGHPNENYARELMELFSLGIGNYTEQDVRESARAFTGWVLRGDRKAGQIEAVFVPRQHDDGSKTFLGHTGNFDGDAIVDLIVQQPASARFIAKKLFSFFAYPNPSDDVLQPLVAAYTASNYSIKALVRAILTSDAFYSATAYRALVKSPADLVAGTVRALGLDTDAKGLPQMMAQMGQELFNPPNVAGWPGGPAWLASGTWLARLNFANRVVGTVGPHPPAPSPAALGRGSTTPLPGGSTPLSTSGGEGSGVRPVLDGAPGEVVDRVDGLLLDGQISPDQRQVLVDYLTPPNGASPGNAWLDERRRGTLYLALAMPEYHLA
jgi:hypothetical protein